MPVRHTQFGTVGSRVGPVLLASYIAVVSGLPDQHLGRSLNYYHYDCI